MARAIPPLTSLRFFAALWVALYDYWAELGARTPGFITKGHLGVELFFVLSGFILCHVYLPAFGEKRFSYRDFLWARVARIYPVHLATLLGIGVLAAGAAVAGFRDGGGVLIWRSLPAQLTLTQAWGLGAAGGWNHPSWSISAEWFAYLAFPAFAFAAWKLRGRPRLAVALALGFAALFEWTFGAFAGFPLTEATVAWGALRIVPCFALGCAVWIAWSAAPPKSPLAAAGALFLALAALPVLFDLHAPDWSAIAPFGLLIFALAAFSSSGSRFLSSRPLILLGEASYSLYMVCIPWELVSTRLVGRIAPQMLGRLPLALWLAQIAGLIVVAIAVHLAIERPAREALRRHGVPFLRRSAARAPAAVPVGG
ncbi:MAG: acyltransferase family protein [Caulobacteraceae bacterium]